MKKVRAEIKSLGTIGEKLVIDVRVVLSDISPKGVGFFCSVPLEMGQLMALTLDDPKRFYVKGRVTWVQEHDANSHVLSQAPISYRVGLEFVFDTREEEAEVRRYCEHIAANHTFGKLQAA